MAGWLFMAASLAWEAGTWSARRITTDGNTRAQIETSLGGSGAKHLVMVRYAPGHVLGQEWIYNAADIDAAPVVWAEDMDTAANTRLFDYFKDRRVWLLEPDHSRSSRPLPRCPPRRVAHPSPLDHPAEMGRG